MMWFSKDSARIEVFFIIDYIQAKKLDKLGKAIKLYEGSAEREETRSQGKTLLRKEGVANRDAMAWALKAV